MIREWYATHSAKLNECLSAFYFVKLFVAIAYKKKWYFYKKSVDKLPHGVYIKDTTEKGKIPWFTMYFILVAWLYWWPQTLCRFIGGYWRALYGPFLCTCFMWNILVRETWIFIFIGPIWYMTITHGKRIILMFLFCELFWCFLQFFIV